MGRVVSALGTDLKAHQAAGGAKQRVAEMPVELVEVLVGQRQQAGKLADAAEHFRELAAGEMVHLVEVDVEPVPPVARACAQGPVGG